MKTKLLLCMVLGLALSAFRQFEEQLFVVPANWPKPQYDFSKNPLTPEKVELGRELFYDPILSRNNTISCASCHSSYTAFAHVDHALSHGIDNRFGTRNAPALMNLAWQKSFMWDGSVNHLDVQALAPISNPNEMDEKIENVVAKLQHNEFYRAKFYTAFGDSVITGQHVLKAITQFMLTIVSCNSKYDSVMHTQAAFTTQEKNGYKLFQQNCASCHAEPLFTNNQFENIGLPVDTTLKDYGRMRVTHDARDSLRFKVPTLRNIEFSYPYMHDGRFKRLADVLHYYTNGIKPVKGLSKPLLKPIVLTSNDKVDLIAFLLTLTDKKFLFDQRYAYPRGNTALVATKMGN